MILAGRGFQGISTALRLGAGWCLNRAADCAIVAMRWRRPLLAGVIAAPVLAWAAPPAGSDPNNAAAAWFRSLRDVRGAIVCFYAGRVACADVEGGV